jgi:hypothetical protein
LLVGYFVEQIVTARTIVGGPWFVFFAPLTGDGVDVEAKVFLVFASTPTAIDAPYLRGWGIRQCGQGGGIGTAATADDGLVLGISAVRPRQELVGGL